MSKYWGPAAEYVDPQQVETALTAALPFLQGAVKKLEWTEETYSLEDGEVIGWTTDTPFATYFHIKIAGDGFRVYTDGTMIGIFSTEDAAKAAAQADYEARILSAIEVSASDCECTKIQQDETCPIGYPSLLCEICDGKGVAPSPRAQALEEEEFAIDKLRFRAFHTNNEADRQAYFDAVSKWFQDRHYRRMDADRALSSQPVAEQSAAARDVLEERKRQIEAEGWSPEHDDAHAGGEIAQAASCYITTKQRTHLPTVPLKWPWSDAWWKPDGYRRNLVKAGALILAEIERLDRLPASGASE
ncbi:hypothetical protein [Brucella sp. NBRC 12950]|uniref:hypothetical protein n=1 Tax=Brucella sp. NBRC 12950 TaxID=2994518 RepID=UPI00255775AD|nr:hypothetical protein [Brucella sp. NBRC 12950]